MALLVIKKSAAWPPTAHSTKGLHQFRAQATSGSSLTERRTVRTKSIAIRTGLAATLSFGLLGSYTGPAHAAAWHGIEGTVYQKRVGKDWYHSDNQRPKSGTGSVQAQFSNLPKSGITFKMRDRSNRTIGNPHFWTSQETDLTRILAKKVKHETPMYASFKQYNACDSCKPYSFSGSLYY